MGRRWTGILAALMAGLILVLSWQQATAKHPSGSAREVRALWVVRNSITSPEKIRNLVRRSAENGFDTLIVQVRGRGDAFYLGGPEARAEELAGMPEDFDPLATVLQEAQKMGLTVHAWVNMMYVWSSEQPPKDPHHWIVAKRDALVMDARGHRPISRGAIEGAYLCPSNPEVRDHLRGLIRDLASRYPVAGIHLDYIRYPSEQFCYCEGCLSRFAQWLGNGEQPSNRLPARYPEKWNDWRREQISTLVRDIRNDLRAVKEGIMLTAAVWVDLKRARQQKLQDWPRWCRERWLDAVAPMNYTTDEKLFRELAKEAMLQAREVRVWMGIGAWRLDAGETAKRIRIARQAGASGFALFSYGGITADGTSEKILRALHPTVRGEE